MTGTSAILELKKRRRAQRTMQISEMQPKILPLGELDKRISNMDPVDAICELLAIIRFVESTLAPKTNPDGSEVDDIRILKVRIAQLEYTHLLYWRVDRLVKREVAEAYSLVGVARIFMANVRRLAAEAAKAPGGTRQLREEHKDE